MATNQDIIKKSLSAGYKKYLRWTVLNEKDLISIYQQYAANIVDMIIRYAQDDKIVPLRYQQLLDNINGEIKKLGGQTVSYVKRSMKQSIKFGASASEQALLDMIPARYKAAISTNFGEIADGALTAMLAKGFADGIPLSTRVWKEIIKDTQFGIQRQLGLALAQGTSASETSRLIRNMLAQPETIRGAKILANIHPGQGVYKSAFKNAMRFARTEISRAFVRGQSAYGDSKKWIVGYIRREPGPAEDEACANAKDQYYPKGTEPELFHPHEMGYNEPVIDEDKLFKEADNART